MRRRIFFAATIGLLIAASPGVRAADSKTAAKKAASCPAGQTVSSETGGRCCWPGQVWIGSACAGVPTSCPDGYSANALTQDCELPSCGGGTERSGDGVHCCWPGQRYGAVEKKCTGRPTICPEGWVADTDGCADLSAKKEALRDQQRADAEQAKAKRRADLEGEGAAKLHAAAALTQCVARCDAENAQREEKRCDDSKLPDCTLDNAFAARQRSLKTGCISACGMGTASAAPQ